MVDTVSLILIILAAGILLGALEIIRRVRQAMEGAEGRPGMLSGSDRCGIMGTNKEAAVTEGNWILAVDDPLWESGRVSVMAGVYLKHTGDGILAPKVKGDVGYDLVVSETTTILSHGFANIPHNAAVELPEGYWAMVLARSSVNISGKLVILPGLIDTGYRGQMFALTHNLTNEPVVVEEGSRVCQLVLFPAAVFPLLRVERLSPSERGVGGFGSTGGINGEVKNPNYSE